MLLITQGQADGGLEGGVRDVKGEGKESHLEHKNYTFPFGQMALLR